jgi:hypothetical protein
VCWLLLFARLRVLDDAPAIDATTVSCVCVCASGLRGERRSEACVPVRYVVCVCGARWCRSEARVYCGVLLCVEAAALPAAARPAPGDARTALLPSAHMFGREIEMLDDFNFTRVAFAARRSHGKTKKN